MKRSMIQVLSVCTIVLVSMFANAQEKEKWQRPEGVRRGGGERMEGGKRGGMERPGAASKGEWFERLQKENPEEFERMKKMREENPEAFRNELRQKIKSRIEGKMHHRGTQQDAECQELSEKYQAAESEEEKAAIKAELQAKVFTAFDSRLEGQKKMIAHLEEQLKKLKKQVSDRESRRDEICEKRIQSLTEDPNLRW